MRVTSCRAVPVPTWQRGEPSPGADVAAGQPGDAASESIGESRSERLLTDATIRPPSPKGHMTSTRTQWADLDDQLHAIDFRTAND